MLEYSGTLLYGLRQMGEHDVLDALKTRHLRSPLPARGRVAGLPVGPRRRPVDAGAGFPAARPGLAASLRGPLRPRGAGPGARLFAVGDGAAQPSGRRLRVRQDAAGTAATSGCWSRSTPSSSPTAAPGPSTSTCRTGWSAPTPRGETAEIIAIIKTQGSDTKLVAQMQPYYEAKSLNRWELAGQAGAAAGDADRRRRERRRDDERVPAASTWRSCASAAAPTRR